MKLRLKDFNTISIRSHQMEQKHNFDRDPDWSITDAHHNVGLHVASISKISGNGNRQVNQEQN